MSEEKKIKTEKRTETVFWGEYEGCNIEVFRDTSDEDWYIIVNGKDGEYLYDGWCPDSKDSSMDDAIEEALHGSELKERGK